MFGYLCNQYGKQLSDEVIKDTLKNIGVRGITERIRRKGAQQLAANFGEKSQISPKNASAMIAIAKGTPSAASWKPNLSFELAVTFSEDGETNALGNYASCDRARSRTAAAARSISARLISRCVTARIR